MRTAADSARTAGRGLPTKAVQRCRLARCAPDGRHIGHDGMAAPSSSRVASVTAGLWRWRSKRPAVVLNLHPDAACGCSRSRLVAGASPIREGAFPPPLLVLLMSLILISPFPHDCLNPSPSGVRNFTSGAIAISRHVPFSCRLLRSAAIPFGLCPHSFPLHPSFRLCLSAP